MSLEQCRSGDGVPTSVISEAFLSRGVFTSKKHADNMINSIDTDRSGAMSYEEFMAAVDGSNLMQASRLRNFLRSLVTEYPDIRKFYSSRPAINFKDKDIGRRCKEDSSVRVIPLEEDVDNLHYLKSRETMMKMGVKFPAVDEEEKPLSASRRPATAGSYRREGRTNVVTASTSGRTGSLLSGHKQPTIARSFLSDESHDRGHYLLPTIDFASSPRLDDISEGICSSDQNQRREIKARIREMESAEYPSLSTATPPEELLGESGPLRVKSMRI